jgi:predicted double-glycine peptidase
MHRLLMSLALTASMASTAGAHQAYLPSLGGGGVIMPVTSIRQARLAGTLLQQYDFSCGSAALATLLTHHYGYPVSESTVFESMYRNGDQSKIQREGFSLFDMKRFLQAQGFEADGFEQPLDQLAQTRVPAIVLINENGYQHFVVVKGLRGDRVLIGDPANGTRAVARTAFEASWQSRLLFVIHNRMESARFNMAADWRAAPQAPLLAGVNREGLSSVTMPKHGPGDF